eukprot:COSAG01_NODE_3978_length_5471_cov_3.755862_5_plen_63_part_00
MSHRIEELAAVAVEVEVALAAAVVVLVLVQSPPALLAVVVCAATEVVALVRQVASDKQTCCP